MTDKDLYWQNDMTPASRRYGDIYFSAENGLLESRHTFLAAIDAPEIWQNKAHFTLLENGFGCGLNFAATCQEWLKTTSKKARLTYIATEKHPLSLSEIDQALSAWSELKDIKEEILGNYPNAIEGFHQRVFFSGRITLLLLIGNSLSSLKQLEATVDAIYLDGFSPKSNPDMWSEDIFSEIARMAAPHARLATYTAAGFVRRGLETAQFKIEKFKGFGKKRESLQGKFAGQKAISSKPWFIRPQPLSKNSKIAVIGAGIAGLVTAHALQMIGYNVTLYEQDKNSMNKASGNPAGILDPAGATLREPYGEFYQAALLYALTYYNDLDPLIFMSKGLMKYPKNPSEERQYQKILESKIFPPNILRDGQNGALYFPECGAISPPKIRDILTSFLNIKSNITITALRQDNQWTLFEDNKICDIVDGVVICGGIESIIFPETAPLPLVPVRGQITLLDAKGYAAPPHHVLCGKAYIIPPFDLDGKQTILTGASFVRDTIDLSLRAEDHQENLKNAAPLWPEINKLPISGGRCAIRAASPDHMPLCGPVPNNEYYHYAYKMLKHGPKHQIFSEAPYHQNLYILSGLGARGFLSAPLLGAMLCAIIAGEPLPLPRTVYESLHPARFIIRNLVKGS
ncbi:MAG: bifunctional tRNA (5-methylaminomethyl-2-thiouridine)(34)-methyltransferase MnmD/FAD-dependent 5-carboxymethylaminomethyl-2-thiouridine(34) oxidoreductase MnmC [Emcibacter sp.]|nr:bifunctional tRNA (5-methylaminomethyl-2-thiouridine)(34)-methyltransferase MnmD/FAD-dependent 5-carboxymethylaminomethyl-2-thiouridine(34) oxidoreductase MnmC [Emcibacter sp.]